MEETPRDKDQVFNFIDGLLDHYKQILATYSDMFDFEDVNMEMVYDCLCRSVHIGRTPKNNNNGKIDEYAKHMKQRHKSHNSNHRQNRGKSHTEFITKSSPLSCDILLKL